MTIGTCRLDMALVVVVSGDVRGCSRYRVPGVVTEVAQIISSGILIPIAPVETSDLGNVDIDVVLHYVGGNDSDLYARGFPVDRHLDGSWSHALVKLSGISSSTSQTSDPEVPANRNAIYSPSI